MNQNLSSMQYLILRSILSNSGRVLYSQKRGYRTHSLTGKELNEKIQKLRVFLNNNKIRNGDKAIILGYGSVDWVIAYYACILSGIIVVPLDVMSDKELIKNILKQVKAKIIFLNKPVNLKLKNLKSFYFEDLEKNLEKIVLEEMPYPKLSSNSILEIQYTSGTTGDPKGVILTHANIVAAVRATVKTVNLNMRLRFLNVLPLSHVFGQIMGIFFPLYFGYNVFFTDTAQPRKIISTIRNKRINVAIFVPGILSNIKKHLEGKCAPCNLGFQFRIIGVGGAVLDTELEKWWKRKLIIVLQGYGLTETAAVVSLSKPFATKTGSVGKVADIVNIKFGRDNEIMVRGANVSSGYYKDKKKTKESFENGWFMTGDVGGIKNNYLFIKDRKKDVIITPSGLKAYPSDIENVLNSINGVREGCVLEKDKKVHAIFTLQNGKSPEQIIKEANQNLLGHQQIASYTVWSGDFPKTPTGKIRKFVVLQEIIKSSKPKNFAYSNKIYSIIHNTLSLNKKIDARSKLVDLGMDSLKRVELITELERHFDVEIDEIEINQNTTVEDLEKLMNERAVHHVKFRMWPTYISMVFLRRVYQKLFLLPIVSIFARTSYMGLENIAKIKSPVIFVSNHQSAFDVPVMIRHIKLPLAAAADGHVVFGIGEKNLFKKFLRKCLGYYSALAYNAYPFGTMIGTDTSLEFTGEMLDRSFSIILFPEGERTLDGKIHDFKSGIGFIVNSMKVPVVPVKLGGLFEILPRNKAIPRIGKASVTFGKVIDYKTFESKSYDEITEIIEKKVRGL